MKYVARPEGCTPTETEMALFVAHLRKDANDMGCWKLDGQSKLRQQLTMSAGYTASALRFSLYIHGYIENFNDEYYVNQWSCYCRRVGDSFFYCINPEHAQLTTNIEDLDVEGIRADYRRGCPLRDIADKYGAAASRITRITAGIPSFTIRRRDIRSQIAALMFINGTPVRAIARHLKIAPPTVYELLKHSGEYFSEKEFEAQQCEM